MPPPLDVYRRETCRLRGSELSVIGRDEASARHSQGGRYVEQIEAAAEHPGAVFAREFTRLGKHTVEVEWRWNQAPAFEVLRQVAVDREPFLARDQSPAQQQLEGVPDLELVEGREWRLGHAAQCAPRDARETLGHIDRDEDAGVEVGVQRSPRSAMSKSTGPGLMTRSPNTVRAR